MISVLWCVARYTISTFGWLPQKTPKVLNRSVFSLQFHKDDLYDAQNERQWVLKWNRQCLLTNHICPGIERSFVTPTAHFQACALVV